MHAAAELARCGALAALLMAAGCSSMQRVPVAYINEAKPEIVHLANSYGVVTSVQNPRLSGDTVYGILFGQGTAAAVPLGQVESISTIRFSTGRTVALVTGATGVTALAAYAMFGTADNDEDWYCDWGVRALEMNGGSPICGPRQP